MQHPKELILASLKKISENTLLETLQMEFVEIGEEYIIMKMPVTSSVHQPQGLLHGGASAALAETAGSVLSALHIDIEKYVTLGLQLSVNHLKSVKDGFIFAKATFVRKGKSTHLVQIHIEDQDKNLVCMGTLTNYIKEISK